MTIKALPTLYPSPQRRAGNNMEIGRPHGQVLAARASGDLSPVFSALFRFFIFSPATRDRIKEGGLKNQGIGIKGLQLLGCSSLNISKKGGDAI